MQPSKEDCIILGEAIRVAGFKAPWGQVAAGLHFAPAGDDSSVEVANDAKNNGVFHALSTYCGVEADTPMAKAIDAFYAKIEAKTPICEIL